MAKNREKVLKTKNDFYQLAGVPGVIGYIDGSQIPIVALMKMNLSSLIMVVTLQTFALITWATLLLAVFSHRLSLLSQKSVLSITILHMLLIMFKILKVL